MPIFHQKSFGTAGCARAFGSKRTRLSATAVAVTAMGILVTASPVHAQTSSLKTLLGFSFSSSTTADTVDVSVNPSSATLDTSRIQTPASGSYIGSDNGFPTSLRAIPFLGGTSDSASVNTIGTYFAFTLTADSMYDLNLNKFQFDVLKGGASDPRGYDVRSSLDGYSTSIVASDLPTGTPTGFQTVSADLSGTPGFQNLRTVTFRVYVYAPDPPPGSGGRTVDFRNLFINGTSDVLPEPGAFALVLPGIAVMGAVAARRRRRS